MDGRKIYGTRYSWYSNSYESLIVLVLNRWIYEETSNKNDQKTKIPISYSILGFYRSKKHQLECAVATIYTCFDYIVNIFRFIVPEIWITILVCYSSFIAFTFVLKFVETLIIKYTFHVSNNWINRWNWQNKTL